MSESRSERRAPRPSWVSYAALTIAFHALANTETGELRAVFMVFSFLWAIPTFLGLVESWRRG